MKTNEIMNRERFAALAEAFGGSIARWPQAEHAAAEAFVTAEPAAARALLEAAGALDALLDRAPAAASGERVKARALEAFEAFEAKRPAASGGFRALLSGRGGAGFASGLTGWRAASAAVVMGVLSLGLLAGYGGGRALILDADREYFASQSIFGDDDVFSEES